MSFNFTCPFCKQVMECEDAWAGLPAKCPSCGRDILMNPPPPEEPSGAAKLSQYMPRKEEQEPAYTQSPVNYAVQNGGVSLWERVKQSWKIVIGAIIVIGVGIGAWEAFYGPFQTEVMSTSKELVTKILFENFKVDYVELVEIRDLERISSTKWEGKAYVRTRTNGFEESGTFDMTFTRRHLPSSSDGRYEDRVEISNFRPE